jgi:hypothetical protein
MPRNSRAVATCALLLVTLLPGTIAKARAQPLAPPPVGPAKFGLAVGLSSASSTYHVNQPISVAIEIRNVSSETPHIEVQSHFEFYDFSVVDMATGKVVLRDPSAVDLGPIGASSFGSPLPPGKSWIVSVLLSYFYKMDHPGDYAVTVSASHVGRWIDNPPLVGVVLDASNTIVITILPSGQPSPSGSTTPFQLPVVATAISVILESQSATYHAAEPILLKVSFKNDTADPLLLDIAAPWHTTILEVRDSQGAIVQPATLPSMRDFHVKPLWFLLKPGASEAIYGPGENTDPAVAWIDLRKWGYAGLAPGTYTIGAKPHMTINLLGPDKFATDGDHVHSNVVTVVVVP